MDELEAKLYGFRTHEVARMLWLKETTVRHWCITGKLKAVKFDRLWFIEPGEVTRLKEKR